MQIDHSKLPKRYNTRYLASQAVRAVVAIVFLAAFYLSDRSSWQATISLEVSYMIVSAAVIAVIAFVVFVMRSRFDPTGIIYDLPEGQTPATRRLVLRKYALMFLFLSVVFVYLISLFVPECAFSRQCIDFSEESPFIMTARAIAPIVILLGLGQSIGNFFGYAIAWLRS